jgi:hypothetical protein
MTESQEHAKLRAENARLKAENKEIKRLASEGTHNQSTQAKVRRQPLRSLLIFMLVAFATALLVVGNIFFWLGNTVVKQDRFVAATEPIIKNAQVQQTLASYTTNNIFNTIDVQKITEEVLPPRAVFLAPQLTTQLKSTTEKALQTTLAKPSFQEKWNVILAKQHDRLVTFASNYKGDGTISLNDVYNQLSGSLQNTKLGFLANKKIPEKVGSIEVVNAAWLPVFHNVTTNIDTWRLLSVALLVLCIALAVWLSKNKRKTLYAISISASIFMLISLVALRVTRETIAQKADPQYADGVRSALQIFFHPFVLQTATIFFAFTLIAFITWASSTSKSAVSLREKIGLLFSGKMHTQLFGENSNKYADWVNHNRRILEWGFIATIAATMLLVRLTLKSLILYALLMLVAVLAVEVVAGPSIQDRNPNRIRG